MLKQLSNDLMLFKKMVRIIVKEDILKDGSDTYSKCMALLDGVNLPDRLLEKCKDFIVDEMFNADKEYISEKFKEGSI